MAGGQKKKYKTVKKKWVAVSVLAGATLALTGLKYINFISEYVFARGISRAWVFLFGNISSLLPFSLFEVCLVVFVAYAIFCVTTWIVCACKKNSYRFKHNIVNFCLVLASLLLVYNVTAAPAYLRAEFSAVPFYEGDILDAEEVRGMASWYYAELNRLAGSFGGYEEVFAEGVFAGYKYGGWRNDRGEVRGYYTYDELAKKMTGEYRRFDGGYVSTYTPRAKPSFLKFMWKDFRIAGITFVPLGECLTLDDMPPVDLCQTMAHELAHTKGIMREDEANLVSYYILFNAEDDFIRYCGMVWHLYYMDRLLAGYPELSAFAKGLNESLHPGIAADDSAYFGYWSTPSLFGSISGFFNDLYLKLSGISGGTGSYNNQGGQEEPVPNPDYDPDDPDPDVPAFIPKVIEYSRTQKMLISVYQKNA